MFYEPLCNLFALSGKIFNIKHLKLYGIMQQRRAKVLFRFFKCPIGDEKLQPFRAIAIVSTEGDGIQYNSITQAYSLSTIFKATS